MVRPTQETIDTFMSITGSSHSHAVRKLEEYGGNLDNAVNAHFGEVESQLRIPTSAAVPQYDSVNARNQMQNGSRGILPLVSAARSFRPSLLLDPGYRRNLWNQIGSSVFTGPRPLHPHTGDFYGGYQHMSPSTPMPPSDHVQGTSSSHDPQFHGNFSRNHEPDLRGGDVEDQMIQLAIEASKREALSANPERHLQEDGELDRAILLSLKTAKQEKATREQQGVEDQKLFEVHNSTVTTGETGDGRIQLRSSSFQGRTEDLREHSLWDSISTKELDEALMLEAALFGQHPGGTSYQHKPQSAGTQDTNKGHYPHNAPKDPSPSVLEQRRLWEQQDDEYLQSLIADTEKVTNATTDLKNSCVKEGGAPDKMLNEETTAEQPVLPEEPAVDDENAVTLLVRMPDGSRCTRRFLKSDKLQFLFDFIDGSGTVKPGTYRVVKPFSRHSFSTFDGSSSLHELGLTNKKEALFLELM